MRHVKTHNVILAKSILPTLNSMLVLAMIYSALISYFMSFRAGTNTELSYSD